MDEVFDLNQPLLYRYALLIALSPNDQYECVKRLLDIHRLSGVCKLVKFLKHVCLNDDDVDLHLKVEILNELVGSEGLHANKDMYPCFENVLNLMVRKYLSEERLIIWLMICDVLLTAVVNFERTDVLVLLIQQCPKSSFRRIYEFILKIKSTRFFIEMCTLLFERFQPDLDIPDKLLLLQVIVNTHSHILDDIVNDVELDIGLRLEALDILSLSGFSRNVDIKFNNDYTLNSETVHLTSVDVSVNRTLEKMLERTKDKPTPAGLYNTLISKEYADKDRIVKVLNRIFKYNFLKFSKFQLTLKEILEHVWIIISESPHKEQLVLRLEQELLSCSNSCSRGYATRLINVLTGFEQDLGIFISYEDEIYTIFSQKVNKIIATSPIQDILLEELLKPTDEHESRLTLIRYLRPVLPDVWNEIFKSYQDILTASDLDLYSRKVMMRYEGCL
jgi:hypothetical protein